MENESQGNVDYAAMVNYLLKSMGKQADAHKFEGDKPVFLYEFFVFDLFLPEELLKTLSQPLIAFRLLDFPTQTIEGHVDERKSCVSFNQGKSSFFEMEIHQLRNYLVNEPLYIMLVDSDRGDLRVLASSRLNISIFSYDNFLLHSGREPPKPRRNILKLFDKAQENVAEFELSLLIRREYFYYDTNINNFLRSEKKVSVSQPASNMRQKNTEEVLGYYKKEKHDSNAKKQRKDKEIIAKELRETGTNPDFGFHQEESEKEIKTKFKEDNLENRKTPSKIQESLNPYKKDAYVKELKNLLQGNEKNPPPLFYHNKRLTQDGSSDIIVKVINETQTKLVNEPAEDKGVKVEKEKQLKVTPGNEEKPKVKQVPPTFVKYPKRPVESLPLVAKKKHQGENYERKMKTIDRYIDAKSPRKVEEPYCEEEEDNIYMNLYSRIKSQNTIELEKSKRSSKTLPKESPKLEEQPAGSPSRKATDSIKEDIRNSELEVSNKHFEITSNYSNLVKSYNSLSISNSNIEIAQAKASKKAIPQRIKISMTKSSVTEQIEEEINQNTSGIVKTRSAKSQVDEEITEDYNDFDYIEPAEEKTQSGLKEESVIEEIT